jgi:hypothetical protein
VGDRFDQLVAARDAVLAEAQAFRLELEPILIAGLERGLERLVSEQSGHMTTLEAPTRLAFEQATATGTLAAVRAVGERLREPDLWLSPHTAPELGMRTEAGWALDVPAWLAGLLRRTRPRRELGDLDDPGNRIWVAIASAAGPIDGVLEEFGFTPGRRRIGGGRFGVVPRTLPKLDPSGVLGRRWSRYRAAYARYEALARVTD